ncbi:MAG TPA: hypothetical protein VGK74_08160 [Symbiobacteriaceae bacterium]
MKIIADLHCHTGIRGRAAVLDYVTVAMSRGLGAVAITGRSPGSAQWLGMSPSEADRLLAEIAEVGRRSEGLRVFSAVECRVVSPRGELSLPAEIRGQFELVLAGFADGPLQWATHLHHTLGRRHRIRRTTALAEAVHRNEIDVITNPGCQSASEIKELARACAASETALEIGARHPVMTIEHCRVAAREGVKFLINSDAHHPKDVGLVPRGIAIARAAGLKPEQILNSEMGRLFAWLERKKGRGPSFWADWAEQPGLIADEEQTGEPRGTRDKSYWTDWSTQGKVH